MKRNNKARILVGLFAIATLAGSLSTVVNTYATSINDLKDRFIAQGFYKCYNGKADGQYIMNGDPISPADVTSWKTLIPYDGDVVGASPDQEYTCAKLFESLPNKVTIPSASAGIVEVNQITPALTKLGYKSTAGSSQKCEDFWLAKYDLNHQKLMDGDDLNIQVCANVDADDKMTKLDISPTDLDDSGHRWSFGIDDQGRIQAWISEWGFFEDLEPDVWYTENNTTWNKFISDLNTALLKWQYGSYSDEHNCEGLCYRYYRRHTSASGSAVTATQYKLDRNAYKTAYNKLTNKTYPSTTFTSGEQAALYQDYLVSYYGIEVNEASCVSSGEPKNPDNSLTIGEDGKTDNWHKAKIYGSDGKEKNCYVNATKNEDKEVYGITGKYPSMVSDGKIGLVGILAWLNSSAPSTIPADLAGTIGQPDSGAKEEDEDSGDDGTKSCYDGAGALGWVLCAVLDGVSSAVDAIYTNFIEPALTINADLLTVGNNEENGAYATWQIFQTFANIIFVIMILVVIFSQLTGVGIDNYGIKRILPRLIIAAILINLSFIICQLLVDLSNILGVSLKNLFDGLGQDVGGTGQVTTAGGHVVSTFVVIITGAVAAGAFLSLGLGVIIPILIAALSALIAIFFLFLVLAGRQAAVVILVVMSPLALVMYMLPNTKQYFDKFIKIFVTLLIVFPICGLVMGGGDFVSRMLLRAGGVTAKVNADGTGFFYQISAILVSIVPFFFIPSLVKNSLAGLGNIGAKISSIGSGVKGKATGVSRGALDKSRLGAAAKQYRDDRERRIQLRRAEGIANGRLSGRYKAGKKLSDAQLRRLANAQSAVDKFGGEALDNRTSLAMKQFGNSSESALRDAWRDSFTSGDSNQLKALTNVMQKRFGSNAAKFVGEELEGLEKAGYDAGSDSKIQDSLKALQDYTNNDGKFAGDLKSKAYDAHAMITSGGVGGDGGSHNLSYFTNTGKLDTIQDISTQSTSTLRRAQADGTKISQQMAQSIVNSDDPNIKSGIMSDADKAKIINQIAGTAPSGPTPGTNTGENHPTDGAPTQTPSPSGPTGPTPTGKSGSGGSGPRLDNGGQTLNIDHSSGSAPQNPPRESGTSTEDWEDYLNGTGDFAP